MSGFKPISTAPALSLALCLFGASGSLAASAPEPVVSQGDAMVHADLARAIHGLDGDGIAVGVISDSFDCMGGAATGRRNGELPPEVEVLQEGDCRNEEVADEGRAMLEVLHDLAPKARLLFHAMGNTTQDFSQALRRMADSRVQIIVDDAVFFHEPMFQDGLAAKTIDQLVFERGIAYFSAAGNVGRNSYQTAFSNSRTYPSGQQRGVAHDFNPDPKKIDTCQSITVGADIFTVLSLQWDQPSRSVTGNAGSNSDLDIQFFDDPECKKRSVDRVIGGATDNLGQDAMEVAGYANNGNRRRKTLGIRILLVAGPEPGLIQYVLSGSSLSIEHPHIDEYATPGAEGSAFGHANAAGAFVVGAMEARLRPGRSMLPAYYSSPGGVPILFDQRGVRLQQPEIRNHVDALAPTNVNTSFFSTSRPDPERDGKPNFTGTSAAAPHAAGVAALVLQAAAKRGRNMEPSRLYDILRRSSLNYGAPGHDFATGYGLLQADRAVQLPD